MSKLPRRGFSINLVVCIVYQPCVFFKLEPTSPTLFTVSHVVISLGYAFHMPLYSHRAVTCCSLKGRYFLQYSSEDSLYKNHTPVYYTVVRVLKVGTIPLYAIFIVLPTLSKECFPGSHILSHFSHGSSVGTITNSSKLVLRMKHF